ncbi:hypothetical protein PCANC_00918 [Puccinia coronata f. sp. avenae]|uniref:Uncharacterized protein n=1 Tax=Puccinia coronata f. sp. avenae TaxID=200324 RepID=A0A2N5W7N6_9BASI|nr:hypothetical protein PCANC_00918 [Puccinia coronata f. sp. avenae]
MLRSQPGHRTVGNKLGAPPGTSGINQSTTAACPISSWDRLHRTSRDRSDKSVRPVGSCFGRTVPVRPPVKHGCLSTAQTAVFDRLMPALWDTVPKPPLRRHRSPGRTGCTCNRCCHRRSLMTTLHKLLGTAPAPRAVSRAQHKTAPVVAIVPPLGCSRSQCWYYGYQEYCPGVNLRMSG